ncbi:MAG TPA: TMEM165/GDT1 family protein [Burkholderiaceae bacterium]|jgi:putative Ca2+/H+ antiporter (TMEM165/GDT1 family)|nr:TMEM165/GDT1 family protein [Burkholderiaceae bacterium]
MQVFLISAVAIAINEVGDKTQLLAIVLAARFKRPWAILTAIGVATLVNHAVAGTVGVLLRHMLRPDLLRVCLGISFLVAAAWALKPDRLDQAPKAIGNARAFAVTLVSFFIAEIGDKTQLATVMLAARYPSLLAVVAGTTTGMLLANVPAVFLGHVASDRIPFKAVRIVAAVVFAALGAVTLIG